MVRWGGWRLTSELCISEREKVRLHFLSLSLFLRQRTFLTAILMGDLLKHIQHPHNFDLRSVPQLVISHTNISQYPAPMLCLVFLPVFGTCDYPRGISPL